MSTFRCELDHLVHLNDLVCQQKSKCANPSFVVLKKGGSVHISSLLQLNKVIKQKQYPLPIITDILRKCIGYMLFVKVDISMQYYTFELDEASHEICTLITPFGEYKHTCLSVGFKFSLDSVQSIIIKQFDIYTDSSDYQMGVCIMQEGRCVANYSKKFNCAQKNYTITEKDMLSIVITQKNYNVAWCRHPCLH
eukprot:CCRYP_018428-RA/>CCRYP_018428-RA protein AED:0.25 eAED:-0.06 QI:0/-1/0/1/-1/0/1/0/193